MNVRAMVLAAPAFGVGVVPYAPRLLDVYEKPAPATRQPPAVRGTDPAADQADVMARSRAMPETAA